MTTIVSIEELGRRIRKLRLEQRLTLKQVEETSGLSATHLSEIERGRTSPTIGALVRIARALGRETSYFIETEERSEVAHVSREQLRSRAHGAATVEALTPGIPGSRMYSYRVLLRPGARSEFTVPAQEHPGDALYYVRQGALASVIGETRSTLGAGDGVTASRLLAHRFEPANGEPAEMIAVFTHPLEDP